MIVSLFRVLFGFVVACLAAALVQLGFALTPAELMTDEADKITAAAVLLLMTATHSAVFAAPFALVAAAIGEWQSVRSWIYYALSGVAIAVAGFIAQYSSESAGQPTIVNNYALTAYLSAGLAGGMAYWLCAGRSAGNPHELDTALEQRPRPRPRPVAPDKPVEADRRN